MPAKPLNIIVCTICFILLLSVLGFTAEEQITITTFYPSPYGSYKELNANKLKIGTTYSADTVSIEDNDLIVEGNVGIGTTSPEYKLHLFDTGGSVALLEGGGTGSTNNVATLKLQDDVSGDNWSLSMRKSGGSYPQAKQLRLFFYDDSADTYDEYLRLMPDTDPTVVHFPGRVGIGTDSPQANLDVVGGVKIGSTTTCNSNTEGTLRYNSDDPNDKKIEFCDGTEWRNIFGEKRILSKVVINTIKTQTCYEACETYETPGKWQCVVAASSGHEDVPNTLGDHPRGCGNVGEDAPYCVCCRIE